MVAVYLDQIFNLALFKENFMFVETFKNNVESIQRASIVAQENMIKQMNEFVWPSLSSIEKFDTSSVQQFWTDAMNPVKIQQKMTEAYSAFYK